MCNYLKENKCSILNNNCPWVYYCNKKSMWIFKQEGKNCKVLKGLDVPSGYYLVKFERRGRLYIDINGQIEIIPNPFNDVPLYVKAVKLKNGKWRLKKYEG